MPQGPRGNPQLTAASVHPHQQNKVMSHQIRDCKEPELNAALVVEEAKDGTPDVVCQESPEPIKEEEKPTGVSATIKTKVENDTLFGITPFTSGTGFISGGVSFTGENGFPDAVVQQLRTQWPKQRTTMKAIKAMNSLFSWLKLGN
ncbi:hypothetical protein Tco_1055342 [Tanacetum coccineum]|uniref:Uncharacterized protein n=1 Tax=Tanacetum coccineum TaxID=301880 RepID=A0ABQ5H0T8_9ASTR